MINIFWIHRADGSPQQLNNLFFESSFLSEMAALFMPAEAIIKKTPQGVEE